MKKTLGKVDYNENGRRNCQAEIEYELTDDGRFTMSADIWNHLHTDIYRGGQCVDEVASYFPHNKKLKRMVEVWKRWHLNDLQAGCEHQRAMKWGDILLDDTKPKTQDNMAHWTHPLNSPDNTYGGKEHALGVMTKPCPECGYKYGTKWLKEEIPQSIKDEILSW